MVITADITFATYNAATTTTVATTATTIAIHRIENKDGN